MNNCPSSPCSWRPLPLLTSAYAAEYLGREREMGTIAAGRKADLVLVDENPLADIAHARSIAGVMVNGRWIAKKEIDTMLERIAALHADQK